MWDRATKQSTALRSVVLALVYTAVSRFGLSLGAVEDFSSLIRPATGLALAALLLFGSRLWPGVLLGAWIASFWAGASAVSALGIAIGSTLEAVLGAYVMRRLGGFRGSFDRLRHVLGLILGAATVSTLVSATIGIATLSLAGVVRSAQTAFDVWRAWWLGDALGDLVVAPLILSWATRNRSIKLSAGSLAEAVVLAIFLIVSSYLTFFGHLGTLDSLELPYALFPLLVWAALRFELRGATVATAVTSTLAVWGTARGAGPFAEDSMVSALHSLQTFMASAAMTPLVVAAAIMEQARAVRERETILATVSHDLKNPLNTLLVSSEVLVRKLPEEPVRKHHQLLTRSTDRMMRLIADLLDASAIERGQLAVQRRPEDMRLLANEALDLLRPLAPNKNLMLESGEPVAVLCDRERVLQVLSNVIGNAIKFSPDGSTVRVRVQRAPHAASISVQDDGPGIEAGDLPYVFDRYWHTKSARGGSGLGLFIAKGIVEAHGGRIWAESRCGGGSTFHFIVPVSEEPPVRSPHARAMASFVQSLRSAAARARPGRARSVARVR
jgi:signal transduction histidine kinase